MSYHINDTSWLLKRILYAHCQTISLRFMSAFYDGVSEVSETSRHAPSRNDSIVSNQRSTVYCH